MSTPSDTPCRGATAGWQPRGKGEPIRVGVVDDHPIVRESLRTFLHEQEGMRVVAEGGCGRSAIELVRTHALDVLLLDLDMPRRSGMDALRSIKAQSPGLGVIVFSGHCARDYAMPMIRGGANAFLGKDCSPWQIVAAINKVAEGGSYITPEVADLLATQLLPSRSAAAHEHLSSREQQVFHKLAQGRTPGEVARELCLSAKTISSYRAAVLRKLEARTNSDLTYYALKHGLLD